MVELQGRWAQRRELRPSAYRYQMRRSCGECAPEFIGPARVEVRDGHVTDARNATTGQSLPLGFFEPIDSLFRSRSARPSAAR
jgi:hypothetical protein